MLNFSLTYNNYRRRHQLKALREGTRYHDPVGGESLFRDHVGGAEEVVCHREDKPAEQ